MYFDETGSGSRVLLNQDQEKFLIKNLQKKIVFIRDRYLKPPAKDVHAMFKLQPNKKLYRKFS
jgi:hypothetical protein